MSNLHKIEQIMLSLSQEDIDTLEMVINNIRQAQIDNTKAELSQKPHKKPRKPRKSRALDKPTDTAKPNRHKRNSNKPSLGKPCRVEPMRIPNRRPNLFLKDPLMNEHKQDSEIDRKLIGNNVPSPRRKHNTPFVDVECSKCGREFSVSQKLMRLANGIPYFVCNDCNVTAKRHKN